MEKMDNSWDVNKYKRPYEMDHHWDLKKKFLLTHKDTFTEERLVSLAQLFCNVHFLGCRYDDSTMELIDSLSKDIVGKNEKWSLQSFVSASVAIEEKVKGQLSNRDQQPSSSKGPINFVRSESQRFDNYFQSKTESYINQQQQQGSWGKGSGGDVWVRGEKRPANSVLNYQEKQPKIQRTEFNEDNNSRMNESHRHFSLESKRIQSDIQSVVDSGPFGKVVVFQSAIVKEENPINIIERTATAAHLVVSFNFTSQEENIVTCKLSLDGLYLASAEDKSQKLAKESACKVAIDRLQETSFTVIVKASFSGSEQIDRESGNNVFRNSGSSNIDTPIADSNIGNKMLKLMGWGGGGLGKNEQGIEEPLKPDERNIRRGGLGAANFNDFKRKMTSIIEGFANSKTKEDLVFSPEFTKDERKVIHELVRKYNLKSRSFGKEEVNRRIVVFKKIRPLEIVEDLMYCGGETDKYKLIHPKSFKNYSSDINTF